MGPEGVLAGAHVPALQVEPYDKQGAPLGEGSVQLFVGEPECLPTEWRRRTDGVATRRTARVVADYIAVDGSLCR